MKKLLASLLLAASLLSCKSKKKKTNDTPYFSVSSFLKGQAHELDTAGVRFTRIETANGRSDTSLVSAADARAAAQDFLNLPDISAEDRKDQYDETNTFDETLNNEILTYTANNPEAAVRTETILLEPDATGNTHPITVLATRIDQQKDATITKDLAWHVGKRFQVVTKTGRKDGSEEVKVVTIVWE